MLSDSMLPGPDKQPEMTGKVVSTVSYAKYNKQAAKVFRRYFAGHSKDDPKVSSEKITSPHLGLIAFGEGD